MNIEAILKTAAAIEAADPKNFDMRDWATGHEADCAALEVRTGAVRYRRGAEIKRASRGSLWMAVHDAEAYRLNGDAVLLFVDGTTRILE